MNLSHTYGSARTVPSQLSLWFLAFLPTYVPIGVFISQERAPDQSTAPAYVVPGTEPRNSPCVWAVWATCRDTSLVSGDPFAQVPSEDVVFLPSFDPTLGINCAHVTRSPLEFFLGPPSSSLLHGLGAVNGVGMGVGKQRQSSKGTSRAHGAWDLTTGRCGNSGAVGTA